MQQSGANFVHILLGKDIDNLFTRHYNYLKVIEHTEGQRRFHWLLRV